jgi:hypothetical protein
MLLTQNDPAHYLKNSKNVEKVGSGAGKFDYPGSDGDPKSSGTQLTSQNMSLISSAMLDRRYPPPLRGALLKDNYEIASSPRMTQKTGLGFYTEASVINL